MADNFTFLNETRDGNDDEDDGRDNDNSSPSGESSSGVLEDDFYNFLNLSTKASTEEIRAQYKKLSTIYHPDKHQADPEARAQAEKLFAKLKYIQDVLTDEEKRYIYDTLGEQGLKENQQLEGRSADMDLVLKYKTPKEAREEFEKLQRDREIQRMERQSNPKTSVTVNINAEEIFRTFEDLEDEEFYYNVGPYIELTGFHFFQSMEAPITSTDTVIVSGSVSAENGRGKGNIAGAMRKTFQNGKSAEIEIGGSQSGLDFGFKGSSPIGNSLFHGNCQLHVQSTPEGLQSAMALAVSRNFDGRSNGQIMWRAGGLGGLQTQYIWDNSVTRLVASVHLGVPNTYASLSVMRRLEDNKMRLRGLLRGGTFGFYVECGVEKKVSQLTTLTATMIVGVPTGVKLRLKILRSNQTYSFPIHLCDQILPAPVIYGTITPLVLWIVVNKFVIQPYERERLVREKAKLKAQHKNQMAEKKSEAEGAVKLMKITFERIVQDEVKRHGLIITKARYGRLIHSASEASPVFNDEVVDVTIPLQVLVMDSKLVLQSTPKSTLPGFYDPIPWEEKSLLIQYLFRNKSHEVIVRDTEAVTLPFQGHQVNST